MKKAIGMIFIAVASFSLGAIGISYVPKNKEKLDIWNDAFAWGYRCRELEEISTKAAKRYYKAFKSYVNIQMTGS